MTEGDRHEGDPIYRGEEKAGGFATANTVEGDMAYWLAGSSVINGFKNQFGRLVAVFSTRPNIDTLLRAFSNVSLADGESIVDDGANGGVYGLSGTEQLPIYRPYFMPIHLYPNKINRLRFILGGVTMEAGSAWQVRMSYRPRRISI